MSGLSVMQKVSFQMHQMQRRSDNISTCCLTPQNLQKPNTQNWLIKSFCIHHMHVLHRTYHSLQPVLTCTLNSVIMQNIHVKTEFWSSGHMCKFSLCSIKETVTLAQLCFHLNRMISETHEHESWQTLASARLLPHLCWTAADHWYPGYGKESAWTGACPIRWASTLEQLPWSFSSARWC